MGGRDVFISFIAQGANQRMPHGLSTKLHVAALLCRILFRHGADNDVISNRGVVSPSRLSYSQMATRGPTIWIYVSFAHDEIFSSRVVL